MFIRLMLLFACSAMFGQSKVMLIHHVPTASSGVVYTENFDSFDDLAIIGGEGYWETEKNVQRVNKPASDGEAWSNASGSECATAYGRALNNDQYATGVVTAVSAGGHCGVAVRCSGTGQEDYYAYYGNSNGSFFAKVVSGSYTQFGSQGDPWSVSDVVRIEAEGTTISAYKNGVLDTSVGTGGTVTDASLASGFAGLSGWGSSTTSRLDDWEGGEL